MTDAPQHPDQDPSRPNLPDQPNAWGQQPDRSQPDFEQPDYQQPDYQQPGGYPQPGDQQPGSYPQQGGYPQQPEGYPQSGYPHPADQPGAYSTPGYQQAGGFTPGAPLPVDLPPERVGRGTALALIALPVGVILTALVYRLGFIASISIFAMAALAPFLYQKASGGRLKKGIPVIVGLVVVGVVLCFFGVVSTELFRTYHTFTAGERATYGTLPQFWAANIVNPDILSQFARDAVLFLLFAALGIFGVVRRLARVSRSSRPT